MTRLKQFEKTVTIYGQDVISSKNMEIQKKAIQHGNVSIYEHSIGVACLSMYLAYRFRIDVDKKSLVRGALLHDYFLYDWHLHDKNHRLHGFRHAKRALTNASNEFFLNPIEQDIIERHMFPLNITPPKYKESVIVCIADKICTVMEVMGHLKFLISRT